MFNCNSKYLVSGVLFGEASHRLGKVVGVLLVLRLDRHRDDGVGNVDGLHGERLQLLEDEAVAGGAVQAEEGADVSGKGLGEFFLTYDALNKVNCP